LTDESRYGIITARFINYEDQRFMINSKGIIQNNKGISELLKNLKSDTNQYETLSKEEERRLIDEYVYKGKEDDLRIILARYNIRMVFHIAKKYCKNTRDFDNMIAMGLYGLVYAANRFDFYKQVTKKVKEPVMVLDKTDPLYGIDNDKCRKIQQLHLSTGKPIFITKEIPVFDELGEPVYVRFCTHAYSWIFKYVVDEFEKKSIIIDNNSISINDAVKIKNSTDNNMTMENYIENMLSPDYVDPKTMIDQISDGETTEIYKKIHEYVSQTNELTAVEKHIIIDTFYNNRKIKDLAEEYNTNSQAIINKKVKALQKIKNHLVKKYNIRNFSDISAV